MKSVVLCETTLIQHQGDPKNLKENSNEEQVEDKANLNGTADGIKSESEVLDCNSKKNENVLQNGKKRTPEEPSLLKVSNNGKGKTAKELNSDREECAGNDEKITTVTMEINDKNNKKSESSLESTKNSFDTSENLNEISKARNSSKQDSESEKKPISSFNIDSFDEVCDEVSEVLIIDDSERVSEQLSINSTSERIENGFLSSGLRKLNVEESEQPLNEEIFDVDSNKENVKDAKTNSLEDLRKDGEEEGSSCEIQVEKVQSVSSQDPDFVWPPNDSEKLHQDTEETSHEKELEEPEDIFCNEELQTSFEDEKETDCQALEVSDSASSEHVGGELQMEVEEAEQETDANEKENKSGQTEWDEASGRSKKRKAKEKNNISKVCLTDSKKRSLPNETDGDRSAKKVKLSKSQNFDDSADKSRMESLASEGIEGDSSKVGETSFEVEAIEGKVIGKEKIESTEEGESAEPSSSFLASFRGTLKNLTRSDLEELIVQKLCEVITERSTVGELRRKAQALEQDQERWKVKVQTLSKQMKEMEMVMKKYMSEVQKQLKEKTNQMVTPLRVTRSVGLQVSFYSYPNRGSKPNPSPPSTPCPAQTINMRSSKGSPKPPPQYTPVSQNLRSRSVSISPKNSPSLQKTPITQQRRNSVAPNSTPPNRTTTTAAVPITSRPTQAQVSTPRPVYKPVTSTVQQQHLLQQSQQLQQQQGSKVIDLTEDDDQRTNNIGKSNTQTRVVSHLQQPGAPPSNRYAYLVPATSTSTGIGGTQNRQVLIATPAIQTPQQNRQIMCSMPPLLFKGGNQVQPTSQSQAVSQNNNRVILPKVLRHPAPLPQAPIRNWANMKQLPPRPALKISKVQTGIVLSWNMVLGPEHAPIRSYQLYAYQESNSPPATSLWKKVGDVKALPLPMACTLTQFMSGHKYHFAVRAVDLHSRIGPFSFPGTIVLDKGR